MKRLIITSKQLGCLNEENNINVSIDTTGNTIPSYTNAITANRDDIANAGKIGDPIIHMSNPNSQNGSNDNSITQHVEVGKGESIERAMQNQLNPTAIGQGGDVEISGDGVYEEKAYAKREIEEARLKKMRAEGKVMTKKQLKESFLMKENSRHFENDMAHREYIINHVIGGRGKVVLKNVIDRGHRNGPERFELTDNGIIDVYNNESNKHITVLFARVGQLVSRFGDKFEKLPKELQDKIKSCCREWQRNGYNEL